MGWRDGRKPCGQPTSLKVPAHGLNPPAAGLIRAWWRLGLLTGSFLLPRDWNHRLWRLKDE